MKKNVLEEYDAKLDNKRRCVIRGIAAFDRYHVKVFKSGKIEMTPRVLVSPEELSENSLKMIYDSVRNFKKGVVGPAIDFDEFKEFLEDN